MTRVLVVDDDTAVLALLDAVLKHSRYEVVLAEDGRVALDKLDASIDVLLCDKNLPLVVGTQVVIEARSRFPQLTTVLMTAAPEALALSQLGLDGYLAKPFRSNALVVHTIESARQRRKASLERAELEMQLAATRSELEKRR
ncbi:MAG: response regulator [Archangium sp.]|nr:response regulator [Archangium sp.]